MLDCSVHYPVNHASFHLEVLRPCWDNTTLLRGAVLRTANCIRDAPCATRMRNAVVRPAHSISCGHGSCKSVQCAALIRRQALSVNCGVSQDTAGFLTEKHTIVENDIYAVDQRMMRLIGEIVQYHRK